MFNLTQLVKFHRDLLQKINILFDFVYYYVNACPQSACRSSVKLLTPQFRQQ